jgi:uncharacterized membrane protein YedE/YeeE
MELFTLCCPWYVAGPIIGLLIVGLLWSINKPLGALGGYIDTVSWVRQPAAGAGWRAFFLLGIIAGGLLSALASGGWHPTLAYGSFDHGLGATAETKAIALLAGGTLIGYGARVAGGCTSGHGMCGTAMGSPASLVATATFMTAAIVTAHLLALAIGG